MKTALSILFYTLLFVFLGTLAIAFACHLIDISDLIPRILFVYSDLHMRLITGLSGIALILLSLAASQVISGKIQREKTIAFANPNGQVTITLSAVEDLIKRLANQLSEIKDTKAIVKATKKASTSACALSSVLKQIFRSSPQSFKTLSPARSRKSLASMNRSMLKYMLLKSSPMKTNRKRVSRNPRKKSGYRTKEV